MPPDRQPAAAIAAALAAGGSRYAFGVPGGGSNLDLVGELEAAGIRFVLAHSETASCIMASTFGLVSGTVAAALATRGPGATSAANGAAQATLDRHPLALITDTVPSASADRVPHQRLDQGALFAPLTKTTTRVGPRVTDETLRDLLALARATPAGTVHFDYDATNAESATMAAIPVVDSVAERVDDHVALEELLASSRYPVVIVGSLLDGAEPQVRAALNELGAPVLSTYQGVGTVSTEDTNHAGLFTNGASEQPLLERADLVILIGVDPVEPIPKPWIYDAPVVSLAVTPTSEPYFPLEVEMIGPLDDLLSHVAAMNHDWPEDAGAAHQRSVRMALLQGSPRFGPIGVVTATAALFPTALATVDAGAHFLAAMPFWPARNPRELLISNGLATMGYALPAAIGAGLHHDDRTIVAFVGDGGLSMTMAELETVARLNQRIVIVVLNDSALSLIEIKQGDNHGGSTAVHYRPMDFAAIAQAQGVAASRADDFSEFAHALQTARAADGPYLIDARIDPAHYPHLITVTRG